MTRRLELIPQYREAVYREEAARQVFNQTQHLKHCISTELSAATMAEAAGEVGRIMTWPSGRRAKIMAIRTHWLNAALAYPVVAYELSKRGTWHKRVSHLYSHIFNFELGKWEFGTVLDGEFHPAPRQEQSGAGKIEENTCD